MNMIILAGRARVGKTTFAQLIAEQVFRIGQLPILMSFASPIREEAKRKGYSKEHTPDKYRQFCQELGASKRKSNKDYWIHKLDRLVKVAQRAEQVDIRDNKKYWERVIIIDDCRYLNEIAYGTLYKATLLFLSSGKRQLPEGEWRNHESEKLSNLLEEGEDPLLQSFTDIIVNDKPAPDMVKYIKNNISIWSGAILRCEEDICECPVCKEHKQEQLPLLLEAMMDLFMLDELEGEVEIEEIDEEEDEEEADDSDT